MSEENGKKKSAMDQVIMGAIIGTAIGSAIGVGLAPKKGSETRQIAKETGTGLFKVAKKLFKKLLGTSKPTSEEMKAIPDEMEILPPSGPTGAANTH